MDYNMMKNIVEQYVKEYNAKASANEKYCEELDKKIKESKDLLIDYIKMAVKEIGCKNVILSGDMYEAVAAAILNGKKMDCTLYKVADNISAYKGKLTCPEEFSFLYKNKDFIFVDDTYCTGKTYEAVKKYVESAGGNVIAAYVFYDDSTEPHDFVFSLNKKDKNVHTDEIKNETSTKRTILFDYDLSNCVMSEIDKLGLKFGDYVDIETVVDRNTNDVKIIITKCKDQDGFISTLNGFIEFFSTLEDLDYTPSQMKIAKNKMDEVIEVFRNITENGEE